MAPLQVVSVARSLEMHTDVLVDALCVRGCGWHAYESDPCTVMGDRVCSNLTMCAAHTHFESAPYTLSSDRVCQALTVCTVDAFALRPPTATSDRICATTTRCYPGEYEQESPTITTDRVCSELSFCNSSEFETLSPTPSSDRVCSARSDVVPTRPFTTAGRVHVVPVQVLSSVEKISYARLE